MCRTAESTYEAALVAKAHDIMVATVAYYLSKDAKGSTKSEPFNHMPYMSSTLTFTANGFGFKGAPNTKAKLEQMEKAR